MQQDAVPPVLLHARNVDPRSHWWDPRLWPVKQQRLACTSSTSAPERRRVRLQGGYRIQVQVYGIARALCNANVLEHITYRRRAGEMTGRLAADLHVLLLRATGCPDVAIAQGVSIDQ